MIAAIGLSSIGIINISTGAHSPALSIRSRFNSEAAGIACVWPPSQVRYCFVILEYKILFLIVVANGAPIAASDLMRVRFNATLDGGARFFDGQPIFGGSKTWRGLISAFLLTVLGALILGLPWQAGVLIATGAMVGDLLSSFIKRRLSIPPSGMVLGLDQIPESLLPLLAVRHYVEFGVWQIAALVAAFIAIDLLLSRVLFKLHLRNRPY